MGCIGLTLFIPSLRMTEALSVAKYPGYQATTSALIPLPRAGRAKMTPREGLNNPHLGRNVIGCGSKIRFEDLSER